MAGAFHQFTKGRKIADAAITSPARGVNLRRNAEDFAWSLRVCLRRRHGQDATGPVAIEGYIAQWGKAPRLRLWIRYGRPSRAMARSNGRSATSIQACRSSSRLMLICVRNGGAFNVVRSGTTTGPVAMVDVGEGQEAPVMLFSQVAQGVTRLAVAHAGQA